MNSLQSDNVTSNYLKHFKYTNDFKDFSYFYISLPISLYPENSPVIVNDMCKSRKYIPITIIAPDGDINANGMKRKPLAELVIRQETTRVEDNDLIDYLKRSDKKTTQKKGGQRISHTLPTGIVKAYLQQMSKECYTLTIVMTLFHKAIKQDQSSIYLLDNSIGNPEELMKHINIMLSLKTTVDIMNSMRTKYGGYLRDKQHLDLFLSSFKTTRNILENHLINIGLHKAEAYMIIYKAICNDNDAK
ncbi:unnamed protein product [Schistosoma margrebowiei]|uniref:Uncharacterized protein n=1 Tax=Schistosoma margrebowiei TaxID=48269 RepID=A0AA84ZHG5_9TREM|nr:unnamed protein product [Schistosoma margrebowiei]